MAGLGSSLHVNQALTNYAIAWKPPANKAEWFARGDFFPNVPVEHDSDFIRSVSQGRMLQIYEAMVGEDGFSGNAPVVDFALNANLAFKCVPAALRGVLNFYKQKQADSVIQLEKRTVDAPRWALEMWAEQKALAVLLNTANYGTHVTTLAANEYWDDYASSASLIYDEIATRLEKIVLDTGSKVNRFGMSFPAWRVIKGHPGLTRRPFNNQAGGTPQMLTTAIFEGLFEEWMEKGAVRIYKGSYNNNAVPNDDGSDGATIDRKLFFGPGVVAAVVEEGVSTEDFSFGKGFFFNGLGDDASGPMGVVERDAPEVMPYGGREFRVVTSADWKITNYRSGWIWPAVLDKTNARFTNDAGNSLFT